MDYKKYFRIVLYLFLAVLGRLLLQWIPGAAPILPVALFTGASYGFEAAMFVGAGSFFISTVLIHATTRTYLFDTFTIIRILTAMGLIITGIFVAVKILKIGKHGVINPEALIYRVIIATIILEIGISALLEGEIFRTPDSFYHLFANIILAAIIGDFGRKGKKEKKETKESPSAPAETRTEENAGEERAAHDEGSHEEHSHNGYH